MTDPIAPLRARFRARIAADRTAFLALTDGDLAASALRSLIHGVAGAAGTFGFADLSRAALQIDDVYMAGQTPDQDALKRLADAMQVVIDAAA